MKWNQNWLISHFWIREIVLIPSLPGEQPVYYAPWANWIMLCYCCNCTHFRIMIIKVFVYYSNRTQMMNSNRRLQKKIAFWMATAAVIVLSGDHEVTRGVGEIIFSSKTLKKTFNQVKTCISSTHSSSFNDHLIIIFFIIIIISFW